MDVKVYLLIDSYDDGDFDVSNTYYKSDEESYAKTVRKVLEDNGISCWMAPDSIPAGSNYMKQIPQAIDDCKVMIILISKKSQQSTWVKNEFSQAVTKHKTIIPYVI